MLVHRTAAHGAKAVCELLLVPPSPQSVLIRHLVGRGGGGGVLLAPQSLPLNVTE